MLSAYCVLGVLHVPLRLRCTCRGGEGSYHPPVYTGGSGSSGRPGSLSKVTDLVRALCDSKVFLLPAPALPGSDVVGQESTTFLLCA